MRLSSCLSSSTPRSTCARRAPSSTPTGDFYGYPGLLDSTRELVRSFSDCGFVPQEILPAGEQVAGRCARNRNRKRSGAPFEKRVGHLFALKEGRVVRWEVFDNPADAFRDAGLSE